VTYELVDGWLYGRLRGPNGRLIPVRRFPQPPFYRRRDHRPDLVEHTTQVAEHYIPVLRYPTEWQVGIYQGDVIVGQHKPTWARGEATDEQDHHSVQIEIQADSRIDVWLPQRDILDALVALMAFLHRRGLVNTALKRPDGQNWPLRVDRLPAATDDYYRRKAGLWRKQAGVYGHIEMPGDEHWDPGGLNYPILFEMVGDELDTGGDKDMALSEEQLDAVRFANGQLTFLEGGPEPPEPGPKRRGYRFARSIKEHIETEGGEVTEQTGDDAMPDEAELKAMREYRGPQERHAGRREEIEQSDDADP
jgi:hypothetical protein